MVGKILHGWCKGDRFGDGIEGSIQGKFYGTSRQDLLLTATAVVVLFQFLLINCECFGPISFRPQ